MVLVDTSVWIKAFMNLAPFRPGLDHLLNLDEVAGHIFVFGELVIGDTGGRKNHLIAYRQLAQAALVPNEEVLGFVSTRRLNGRGIGWIDAHLLASALVSGMKLWTADVRLRTVAFELGVAYQE